MARKRLTKGLPSAPTCSDEEWAAFAVKFKIEHPNSIVFEQLHLFALSTNPVHDTSGILYHDREGRPCCLLRRDYAATLQ